MGPFEIAGIAGTVCLLGAVVVGIVGGLIASLLVLRRQQAAVAAAQANLAEITASVSVGERLDELVERIRPDLKPLVHPRVVRLEDGGVEITGDLGERAVFEIAADGRVKNLYATGSFGLGGCTVRSRASHKDPDDELDRLDAGVLDDLIDQMAMAEIRSIRFETDRIALVAAESAFDGDVGAMIETLAAAVKASTGLVPRPEPEPEPPKEPSDPVAAAFRAIDADDGRNRDDKLLEACKLLFDGVQDTLDKPKQKLDADELEQELRGRIGEIPLRLKVEFDGRWQIQALADVGGWAGFQYDPELKPIEADADDDFAEEDSIRVFVAKGMYVEGTVDDVQACMEWVATAEPAQLEEVRTALVEQPLFSVIFSIDELFVTGKNLLPEEDDPVGVCLRALELAGSLSQEHASGEPRELRQERCPYCSSRYFFGLNRVSCPNCGAPPGA